jgi:serine/threonine-protein kinase RsbW
MTGGSVYEVAISIPSDTAEAQRIHSLLVGKLKEHNYSEKVIFGVKLAFEEALVNAIVHGNELDRNKNVKVRFSVNDKQVTLEVEDEGPGFRPEDVPDPTAPENLERPCGRGLLLMRAYMTSCDFVPPGNKCRMTRLRE